LVDLRDGRRSSCSDSYNKRNVIKIFIESNKIIELLKISYAVQNLVFTICRSCADGKVIVENEMQSNVCRVDQSRNNGRVFNTSM